MGYGIAIFTRFTIALKIILGSDDQSTVSFFFFCEKLTYTVHEIGQMKNSKSASCKTYITVHNTHRGMCSVTFSLNV